MTSSRRSLVFALAVAALVAACSAPEDGGPSAPALSAPAPSASALPAAPPPAHVELSSDVLPERYRLELVIDPREPSFRGQAEIDVRVVESRPYVVLHGRDLKVSRAEAVVAGRTLTAAVSSRRAHGARQGQEELVLQFRESLPQGPATLRFQYEAPFANLVGIYRVEVEGRAFAFSQMEPTDARRAFPSFDEPRHKTPFEITLSVPRGMTAVSNAKNAERSEAGALTRFRFDATQPIPTYLVAVAVGELELTPGPAAIHERLRLVTVPGRKGLGAAALDAAQRTLTSLELYFKRPYPYDKLDIAAVPNFGPGAMENAGLVTFREEYLLVTGRLSAPARRRMALIMAHELAHQWFGNLVTMRWWDDLWLNEGFATWMQSKTCDDAFPGFGARAERVLARTFAMNADVLPSARPVRPKVELADQIREAGGWSAYQKGASVLTMLEAWVGEGAFQKGIQGYVNDSAWRSITSLELFRALDGSTGKPVSKVASTFLDQAGVPLVEIEVTCGPPGKGAGQVRLSQSDASGSCAPGTGHCGRSWTIPICLRVAGEPEPRCSLLEGASTTLAIDGCPWIQPNHGEAGYYRYRLDAASGARLALAFRQLDERERAGLLLNAWALTLLGKAPASDVVALLSGIDLAGERSRVVIEAAISVLAELDRHYAGAAGAPALRDLVKKLLAPQRKRLGMPGAGVAEADHVRLLRSAVLGALFDLADDASVARELEPIARAYLQDPRSTDPDLGPLAVRVSARAGGVGVSELDAKRVLRATTPDERVALIVALFSRRDPNELRAALELLVSGEIRAGDYRHVRAGALARPDTRRVFFDFVRERFDALLPRLGNAGVLTATLRDACDEPELDRLVAFFQPRLPTLEGAQRGFDEGVADARRCIAIGKQPPAQLK